jgi:hypothetical protein
MTILARGQDRGDQLRLLQFLMPPDSQAGGDRV